MTTTLHDDVESQRTTLVARIERASHLVRQYEDGRAFYLRVIDEGRRALAGLEGSPESRPGWPPRAVMR
jgi:hypothetical protein